MTREDQLRRKVDELNKRKEQIEVRLYRAKQQQEALAAKSRGYRKERTHRLIIVGAELERLAGRELSIEDVRTIWATASAHREPLPGETPTGTPTAK